MRPTTVIVIFLCLFIVNISTTTKKLFTSDKEHINLFLARQIFDCQTIVIEKTDVKKMCATSRKMGGGNFGKKFSHGN
jgi:hypothetical protein